MSRLQEVKGGTFLRHSVVSPGQLPEPTETKFDGTGAARSRRTHCYYTGLHGPSQPTWA